MKLLLTSTIELKMLITFFEKYYSLITLANYRGAKRDIDNFVAIFTRLKKYGDASEREIAEECLHWLEVLRGNLYDIREP